MSIFTIWKILKPGKGLPECRSTGITAKSLPEARVEAERLMKEKGWHGVGIRLSGRPHSRAWSYLNCHGHGPSDPKLAERTKLPQYSKVPLPMAGNPIAE